MEIRSEAIYSLLDVTNIRAWKKATKTRPIRAKHVQLVLVDKSIQDKFLLSTIEAIQGIGPGSMICLGESGDIWQQSPETLLKKYTITGFDAEGWSICTPKPDNEVDCYVADKQTFMVLPSDRAGFSILARWGEKRKDGTFIQYGNFGDVVCRSQSDPGDVWIVARKLFDSTYEIKA